MTVDFLDGIVGSFSTGAKANPTVAMMDAAFAHERLAWRYINCEVGGGDLSDAVDGARSMGWAGFNCSIPHKQTVIPMLDELSETASICQAVNCVTRGPSGWIGHNTDGAGFLSSVVDAQSVLGIEAMVIGSGGAAHAIAVELGRSGARRLHVASRNLQTASALARLVGTTTPCDASVRPIAAIVSVPASVRLIVNATPVGSSVDPQGSIPLDWSGVAPDTTVADVVVTPGPTEFLRRAREAGARTIDGKGMLVNQAAENIRLWTGIEPETAPMRSALEDSLSG